MIPVVVVLLLLLLFSSRLPFNHQPSLVLCFLVGLGRRGIELRGAPGPPIFFTPVNTHNPPRDDSAPPGRQSPAPLTAARGCWQWSHVSVVFPDSLKMLFAVWHNCDPGMNGNIGHDFSCSSINQSIKSCFPNTMHFCSQTKSLFWRGCIY